MEYINRIELKGRVGTVRTNEVGGNRVTNFSLITDYLYKTREGNAVSESTWFNITAWEGKDIHDTDRIEKGAVVHVSGRIRSARYQGSDGSERQFYEVMANRLRVVDEDGTDIS
jgi:single stranded DNA-binding protein